MKFGKTCVGCRHFQGDPRGKILVQILAHRQKFFLIGMISLMAGETSCLFSGEHLHLQGRRTEKKGVKLQDQCVEAGFPEELFVPGFPNGRKQESFRCSVSRVFQIPSKDEKGGKGE